jgi:hypothetical protein
MCLTVTNALAYHKAAKGFTKLEQNDEKMKNIVD